MADASEPETRLAHPKTHHRFEHNAFQGRGETMALSQGAGWLPKIVFGDRTDVREWDGPAVLQPCQRAKLARGHRRQRSTPCPRNSTAKSP
jgi:hypothetical protein